MKTFFTRQITAGVLILSMIIPAFSFLNTKKAEAQWSVVEVGPSLVQQTIIAANTTVTSFASYSTQFKEFVLDSIAGMFAKQIIRQLTTSVVNWINSGFEGSPSFITNPSSFFLDLADQETGRFLAKYGGPLTDLCSPFSIDLRISLAFKYHPNIQQRYTCTLGTIINNSKNAVEGASINGFTAGDFSQGGWPAFVSLTTEPQNNIYGAWLQADSELSLRVANLQIQQRDELNQGRGFLSWRKCTKTGNENSEERATEGTGEGTYAGPERSYEGSGEGYVPEEKCEVQTPGSVIVSALESNVNGPLHELQLADELNEIVNALFAQLVTQVLTKGLGGVSGSGPSDRNAYINQIMQEGPEAANAVNNQMLPNLETYINNTRQYKANKDASLNTILDVKTLYDNTIACYERKISNQNLDSYQISIGQAEINQIEIAITRDVTPLATRLLNEAINADSKLKILLDIQASSTVAKTINDLRAPSDKYSQLLQSQSLISPNAIQISKDELEEVKVTAATLKAVAERKLQECSIFPYRRL